MVHVSDAGGRVLEPLMDAHDSLGWRWYGHDQLAVRVVFVGRIDFES